MHRKALYWAARVQETFKPDIVIQMGDIIDAKAWSRFPKDPDDDSPSLEWKKVRKEMAILNKLFPELHIINGNHQDRVMKRALEAGLPRELVKSLETVFDYPGWNWEIGNKPFIFENIAFVHGDETIGCPSAKAKQYGMSIVQGHSHKASIEYINLFDKQLFAAEVGWLGDDTALAFNYACKNPSRSWLGVMLIENGVPHLIPYPG
jgi:predicted phosphodiesterase